MEWLSHSARNGTFGNGSGTELNSWWHHHEPNGRWSLVFIVWGFLVYRPGWWWWWNSRPRYQLTGGSYPSPMNAVSNSDTMSLWCHWLNLCWCLRWMSLGPVAGGDDFHGAVRRRPNCQCPAQKSSLDFAPGRAELLLWFSFEWMKSRDENAKREKKTAEAPP